MVIKGPVLSARWPTSREGLYPPPRPSSSVCGGHWGLRTGHTSSLCYMDQFLMWTSCNRRPGRQQEKDGHINVNDLNIERGTEVTEEVAPTRCYKTPINSEGESGSLVFSPLFSLYWGKLAARCCAFLLFVSWEGCWCYRCLADRQRQQSPGSRETNTTHKTTADGTCH